MAAKKLFITGATVYIGGSVLEAIVHKHPSLNITALLRNPPAEFKTRYPNVRIVVGDFDAAEIISKEAEDADIVIHTGDIDHQPCASAILSGLAKKPTPSFLLHLSGTQCISDARSHSQTWEGLQNPRIWDDIADIDEIYSLPETAPHHKIDRQIMDASNTLLKTAVICPPDIYGQKTGVGNRATFLVPLYAGVVRKTQTALYLGKGENTKAVAHISDVVNLFVLLLEHAMEEDGGSAQWDKEGFYFTTTSEIKFLEAATAMNDLCIKKSLLPADSKPTSWTKERVGGLMPASPEKALQFIGANSRVKCSRAEKLGWKACGPSFWECLDEDVSVAVGL
ncbi:hypothetical protein FQN54_007462 [Arachnomyces sp. PD_36]|nr:hypothetical protein FQN54_007462 [Arachnomyces sp. PD_36]